MPPVILPFPPPLKARDLRLVDEIFARSQYEHCCRTASLAFFKKTLLHGNWRSKKYHNPNAGKGTMPKTERKKELDRRRKRKRERNRETNKAQRLHWEKRKQEKKEEKIVVKKAVTKSPAPEEQE